MTAPEDIYCVTDGNPFGDYLYACLTGSQMATGTCQLVPLKTRTAESVFRPRGGSYSGK